MPVAAFVDDDRSIVSECGVSCDGSLNITDDVRFLGGLYNHNIPCINASDLRTCIVMLHALRHDDTERCSESGMNHQSCISAYEDNSDDPDGYQESLVFRIHEGEIVSMNKRLRLVSNMYPLYPSSSYT